MLGADRADGHRVSSRGTIDDEGQQMPEISRFFGIIIAIYYNDHEPCTFMLATDGTKQRF